MYLSLVFKGLNLFWSSVLLLLTNESMRLKLLFYLKDVKFTENFTHTTPPPTLKLEFNAEIQNFIEYIYPLNFDFNADFQNFNTEILFIPSYLELCPYVSEQGFIEL